MLKDSHTAESMVCAEKALQHYDLFLTQAKVGPVFFPTFLQHLKNLSSKLHFFSP